MKIKKIITMLLCISVILSITSSTVYSKPKKCIITQKKATAIITKYDSKITRLTPATLKNTDGKYIRRYSKKYYMFLVNYGHGEEEYTSERMYLVSKKTGRIYFCMPQ